MSPVLSDGLVFVFVLFFLALYRRTVWLGCVNVAMSETPRSAVEIKRS